MHTHACKTLKSGLVKYAVDAYAVVIEWTLSTNRVHQCFLVGGKASHQIKKKSKLGGGEGYIPTIQGILLWESIAHKISVCTPVHKRSGYIQWNKRRMKYLKSSNIFGPSVDSLIIVSTKFDSCIEKTSYFGIGEILLAHRRTGLNNEHWKRWAESRRISYLSVMWWN